MSTHSLKAKRRHPDAPREHFEVAHVTFELSDRGPESTFALVAGLAVHAKDRRPLFTGFIEPGMADQLQTLTDRVREIEALTASETEES